MNQPHDFRRELLSAYIDGQVSDDERARVEGLIQSDPEFAAEERQARRNQESCKDSKLEASLGKNFADQVWSAILTQADEGQIEESRQVQLAKSRSSQPLEESKSTSAKMARWMGAVAALAACTLLILNFANPGDNVNPGDAINQLVTTDGLQDTPPVKDPDVVPDASPDVVSPTPEMLASDATTNPPAPAPDAVTPNQTPAVPSESSDSGTQISPQQLTEMLAGKQNLKMTMLFQVMLTERGKDINELQYALETVGVSKIDELQVSEQEFGLMAKSGTVRRVRAGSAKSGDTELLLVQGPARQLDRFMISLFNRSESISKIGFRAVLDPNISQALDSIQRIDGKQVRHPDEDLLARHLKIGADSMFISAMEFKSLDPKGLAKINWNPQMTPSGPDTSVSILVLVRHAK